MSVKRNSSESIRRVHLCNQRTYICLTPRRLLVLRTTSFRRISVSENFAFSTSPSARRQSICVVRVTTVRVQQFNMTILISGHMKQFYCMEISPHEKKIQRTMTMHRNLMSHFDLDVWIFLFFEILGERSVDERRVRTARHHCCAVILRMNRMSIRIRYARCVLGMRKMEHKRQLKNE